MNTRTLERVERWESKPFSGGYEGLRDLAGTEFTGAVETAGTWLFMLNGRIVGVHDGTIDAFEDASGTAHVAPDPALPLLFTMWEGNTETRAKYYTEDTPISEVDNTLTSGSFTGYLELSENVLSGDYFVVYYGGRSMSAAFIGTSEELLGGDEAFERANDEVGIYEVLDAEVEVIDIPAADPEPVEQPAAGGDSTTQPSADEPSTVTDPSAAAPETEQSSTGPTVSGDRPVDGSTDVPSAGVPSNDTAVEETRAGPADGDESAAEKADESRVSDATRTVSESVGEPQVDDVTTEQGDPVSGTDSVPEEPAHTTEETSSSDPAQSRTEPHAAEETASTDSSESRTTDEQATAVPPADDTTRKEHPAPDRTPDEPDRAEGPQARTDADDRAGSDVDDTPITGTTAHEEAATETADGATGGEPVTESTDVADRTDDPIEAEADWREATVIPSLDPVHTEHPSPGSEAEPVESPEAAGPGRADRSAPEQPSGRNRQQAASEPTRRTLTAADRGSSTAPGSTDRTEPAGRSPDTATGQSSTETVPKERLDERDERIAELEAEIERLESTREELESERDALSAENESLAETVEGLEAEVERLRSERDELEATLEAAGMTAHDADQQLHPSEAISGTNLFVRYGSKGEATLEAAHDGGATADDVNANLRLERHTTFDAASVAIQGKPYDEFLDGTLEMQFADWLVGTLLYEIRDTGHQGGLSDLYDAIPEIDRIEFDGDVELTYREDGEEIVETAVFDVVVRNRMGEPLIVADLSDSRDPAGERMLLDLESDASRVKESSETLSAAFLVTASFFNPGALEAASEATSGSFLSRDSRMSFVKQSRKQGYHLCLVEARGDEFHLNVPEL